MEGREGGGNLYVSFFPVTKVFFSVEGDFVSSVTPKIHWPSKKNTTFVHKILHRLRTRSKKCCLPLFL